MIVEKIQFYFDSRGKQDKPVELPLQKINLFVGPNNSGKSLALKELKRFFEKENYPRKLPDFHSVKRLKVCSNEVVFKFIKEKIEEDFSISDFDSSEFAQELLKKTSEDVSKKKVMKNVKKIFDLFLGFVLQGGEDKKLKNLIQSQKINLDVVSQLVNKRKIFKKILVSLEAKLNKLLRDDSLGDLKISYPEESTIFLFLNSYIFLLYQKDKQNYISKLWNKKIIDPTGYITEIPCAYLPFHEIYASKPFPTTLNNMPAFEIVKQLKSIQELIYKKLGIRISIDFHSQQPTIRICKEELDENLQLSLSEESKKFFDSQQRLLESGDGIQMIVKLILRVFTTQERLFLLDEPDIFLHPPYAKQLGHILTSHSKEYESQFFIATHNQNLLQGFLEAEGEVNIFRMTYINQVPKIHLLDNKQLQHILKDVNFRFSGILEAIFSNAVILVEGEGDRKIYYLALEVYLNKKPEERIYGLTFVYAGGKNNIPEAAHYLQSIGLPKAIILDADALVDDTIPNIFNKCDLEGKESIKNLKEKFCEKVREEEKLENNDKLEKFLKENGVNSLKKSSKDAFDTLNHLLEKRNIFIVPTGTLENTVPELWKNIKDNNGIKEEKKKQAWQTQVIQKLIDEESNFCSQLLDFISLVNKKLKESLLQT